MNSFSLVPMLQVQRDLYDIPRGWTRFERYLAVMTGGTDDIILPLPVFNPMGKAHVAEVLDALIRIDAEKVASEAIHEAEHRLVDVGAQLKVGLVLADDAGGGWTNRWLTETQTRFMPQATIQRGWAVVVFWTSEFPTRELVGQEVIATLYRTLTIIRNGPPVTLRQMMAQEGQAAAFAGAMQPTLDPEDLTYSREVIRPYLDSQHFPTVFSCLYGDEAAREVGYKPLGLSPRAGYAVALADTRASS